MTKSKNLNHENGSKISQMPLGALGNPDSPLPSGGGAPNVAPADEADASGTIPWTVVKQKQRPTSAQKKAKQDARTAEAARKADAAKKTKSLARRKNYAAQKSRKGKPTKASPKWVRPVPTTYFHIRAMWDSPFERVLQGAFKKHNSAVYDTLGVARPTPDPKVGAKVHCRVLKSKQNFTLQVAYDFPKGMKQKNHKAALKMLKNFVNALIDAIDGDFNEKYDNGDELEFSTRQIHKITFRTICFNVHHERSKRKRLMGHFVRRCGDSLHDRMAAVYKVLVTNEIGDVDVRALVSKSANLTPSHDDQAVAWDEYIELHRGWTEQMNKLFIIGKQVTWKPTALLVTVSGYCDRYIGVDWFKWMVWRLPYLFQQAMYDMIAEEEALKRAPKMITREEQQVQKAMKTARRRAGRRAKAALKKAQNNPESVFNKD